MERNARLKSFRERPHWMLDLDGNQKILGWGNPMTDELYREFLMKHLNYDAMCAFEDKMERAQFFIDKPIMLFHDAGKVVILKPGYVARQEAIGLILQLTLERVLMRKEACPK